MVRTKVTPFGNNHPTSSCDEELPVAQSSKGQGQSLTPTIRQIGRELLSTHPCKASGLRPFPHTEILALWAVIMMDTILTFMIPFHLCSMGQNFVILS